MGFCGIVVILIKTAFGVIGALVADTDAVSALAASLLKISAFFLAAVTFFELTAVCAEISGSSVVCTCKLELSMKLYLFRDG